MRFLHTSDWHVGRTIRARSRQSEHEAVLREIIDIAKDQQVDAVLVTGDVFEHRIPPGGAEKLVAETLAELAKEKIPSIVIPGNHDDPGRLRVLKPLGDMVQVHIVSEININDMASLILPIASRDGSEYAMIGCLPYVHPHHVLPAAEGVGKSESDRISAYQSKMKDFFDDFKERIKATPISLVLAHLAVDQVYGGGEVRSGVFEVDKGILPTGVHYVALGHMHQPHGVKGASARAYYAGSVLQLDFGRAEHQKSVFIIEAYHPGKPATISEIHLSQGKKLLRRVGTAEEILAQADDFKGAWVEIILRPEGRTTELVDSVRALEGVVSIRFEEPDVKQTQYGSLLKDRPAREIFSDYYKAKRKADPDPQLVALFNRLYQEVSTSTDEPQ
jgi:DNA repair protein SbcD/Mre11